MSNSRILRFPSSCATCSALLLIACTGTDVGNGAVDVDFAIFDSKEEAGSAARAVAPDGVTLGEAWVAVDRLRLRQGDDCSGGTEHRFDGPFVVDMRASGPSGALSALDIPPGAYCRFEMGWSGLEDAQLEAPVELLGASFLLTGTRMDGTAFVLRSERNDDMRLDARNLSFSIEKKGDGLFVAFDLQILLDGVDLDGVEPGPDGAIRIERGANEALLEIFDSNLHAAAKLFRDQDGDGELGSMEHNDTDALAD